jgi:hypothetical protein
MTTTYRRGKKPASPPKLKLRDYLDTSALPPLPAGDFGHDGLVSGWGVLANDALGCCAISGPEHESMLWLAMAGKTGNFDDACTIANYSTITGYDPSQTQPDGSNPTDQGSDVQAVAEYRRTTGILDANGDRHQIAAYLALTPGNLTEALHAIHLFGTVGIGVNFPNQWMDATNAGQPWDFLPNPDYEGGHYIPAFAYRGGNLIVVTWGQEQILTPAGYAQCSDEAWVYLTQEDLVNSANIDEFNFAQLEADLPLLAQVH